jgi:hypothetical protein
MYGSIKVPEQNGCHSPPSGSSASGQKIMITPTLAYQLPASGCPQVIAAAGDTMLSNNAAATESTVILPHIPFDVLMILYLHIRWIHA